MEQVMKNQRVALITFDEQEKVFHLSNSEISYILQIEESEVLAHVYFGKRTTHYHNHKKYPRRDRGFSGNVPLMKIERIQKIHYHKSIQGTEGWIIDYLP